jgi:hypothetical protein
LNQRSGRALGFLFGIGTAALLWLHPALVLADSTESAAANAPSASASVVSSKSKKTSARSRTAALRTAALQNYAPVNPDERFFVEFRSRAALSFGHVYVMYGEVNARQEIIRSQIAGFIPTGDRRDCENCSAYNWMLGYLVPVPGEIGTSDGDLEEQYVTARFRVWISEEKYNRLVEYVEPLKAKTPLWHALWNNCGGFARDIAALLGLHPAPPIWMYPKDLVIALREANGVQDEPLPLKDAPGLLGVAHETVVRPLNAHASTPARHPGI